MLNFFFNLLVEAGLKFTTAEYIREILMLFLVALLTIIFKKITDKILKTTLIITTRKKKNKWHNVLVKSKFYKRLTLFIPISILYSASVLFPLTGMVIRNILNYYILIIAIMIIDSFLSAINHYYDMLEKSKKRPIKGFIQITKIIIYCIAVILVAAHLLGKSPLAILGSIGAFAAVIVFIFRDALLGFVSGVQIVANDTIRIGDWIEMPKYNADGEVVDISLMTIKIANFDNAITAVPAYAFTADSFKNWRRMKDKGARRIKRSFLVDINSIHFCSEELLGKLKKINYISDYIQTTETEINDYNKKNNVEPGELYNGRHLTNIGVFRIYIQNYLKNNQYIVNDMSLVVRQLDPIAFGLPIEVYAFANTAEWEEFEPIQSDIFDHIIAIAPQFELEIFQKPSGNDLKRLTNDNKM